MKSDRITIEKKERYGWYVSKGIGEGTRYLHRDREWRKTTCVVVEGNEVFSGYFPTKDAACEAASFAGYSEAAAKAMAETPPMS